MSLFAALELPVQLDLEAEQIEAAWRALSQQHHPDVAEEASVDISAKINEARQVLSRPAGLLAEWLRVKQGDTSGDKPHHTAIGSSLMDLFSEVGTALAAADQVIGDHRKAQTALAKSLLAPAAIVAQKKIQQQMGAIKTETETVTAQFPIFEVEQDFDSVRQTLAELKFLHKWELECQQRLLDLISLD